MVMTSLAKLAVASVYGYGLSTRSPASQVGDALRRDGIYVAPERLPPDLVARLLGACDDVYARHPQAVSFESNGSDARIFGIERLSTDPAFGELQAKFQDEARAFYATDALEQFLMAGDIRYHPDSLGSGSGWHRDSPYRHQFKVIVYLTDTSADEGPFEFVKHSHCADSVLRAARFLKKPMHADRFTNAEVETLIENSIISQPETLVGSAGSMIFVDTRGLHRGRPLKQGRRRALTLYIYHKTMPKNMKELLAKTLAR